VTTAKTIFDESGKLQCCPNCGGEVALSKSPITDNPYVVRFECIACGEAGHVCPRAKGFEVYWDNGVTFAGLTKNHGPQHKNFNEWE
jgi:hypothetical protein